jgi:CBS domain-containing protein
MHLSKLLGSPLQTPEGEGVGKVDDVIVRLRGADYPVVTGLVAAVGGRRVFLPTAEVGELAEDRVLLTLPKVDLRAFERREGEVLLRQDILGHRLIDVAHTELVRAWDVELQPTGEGWVLVCLDTRRPARLLGLLRQGHGHPCEDWKSFEPLVGHRPSATVRGLFGRLRRLKPAQLADLLEDASSDEKTEILEAVHEDPELEADVFEELDPDTATRLFGDKTDAEVADVLAHMRPDDAADALADLPQGRRQDILGLLPIGTRTKVLMLLGFNSTSAGGLMNLEFVICPEDANVSEALRRVHLALNIEPQAQTSVYSVSDDGHLVGVVTVIDLLHADPEAALVDVIDSDPVRVGPQADVVDVALLMADYNLMTVPVVDAQNQILGVVTVDDILEATIPDDWRRREPLPRPPVVEEPDSGSEAVSSAPS